MSAAKKHSGFSLLELLLVLVVIGLIVTVAGLSVTSGSRPYAIAGAVTGFADLAEYALDEAQLNAYDLGLLLERRSDGGEDMYQYTWLARQGLEWGRVPRDELLSPSREFPFGLELQLEMDEELVSLEPDPDGGGILPQVIFFSSGEATPGILRWRDASTGELLWELEWDLLADMQLRPRGEVDDEG